MAKNSTTSIIYVILQIIMIFLGVFVGTILGGILLGEKTSADAFVVSHCPRGGVGYGGRDWNRCVSTPGCSVVEVSDNLWICQPDKQNKKIPFNKRKSSSINRNSKLILPYTYEARYFTYDTYNDARAYKENSIRS